MSAMAGQENKRLYRMVKVALMAAVLSVLSPLSLPIGPVAVTLAIFAVCLTGLLLGPLDGTVATLLYIAIGAVGLPVFSGFRAGFSVLIGPTGGYIYGYLLCAFLSGLLAKRRFLSFFGMMLGVLLCYTVGTTQFMIVTGYGFPAAMSACVLPFIPFDLCKILAAFLIAPVLRRSLPKAFRN